MKTNKWGITPKEMEEAKARHLKMMGEPVISAEEQEKAEIIRMYLKSNDLARSSGENNVEFSLRIRAKADQLRKQWEAKYPNSQKFVI